jgi:hypothetical protein
MIAHDFTYIPWTFKAVTNAPNIRLQLQETQYYINSFIVAELVV